ncbi:MAG: RNA methyltransferase [Treponemataceae bacterium]|nr:RNA methyltransferase [Treponemataceae bacterium]
MKNKLNKELAVCGLDAVKALERNNFQAINRLYFNAERAPLFGGLCKKLAASKKPYNQVADDAELQKLSGTVHHQGVVAFVNQPEIPRLSKADTDQWVASGESVLLLDHVGNANNFGAIIRSAAFFGIRNIVIPLDESQSSVTTSSYRIAQGGMEKVNIYGIQSPAFLLSDLKDKMVRFGTDVRGKIPISKMNALCSAKRSDGTEYKKPAIIVLGNEEHGISAEVRSNCDYLVTIPTPAAGAIESLNVAQAATVILYAFVTE